MSLRSLDGPTGCGAIWSHISKGVLSTVRNRPTSHQATIRRWVCLSSKKAHHSGLELTRAPLGVPRKRVPTSSDPGFRFEDCLSNKASSTSNTNPSTLWGVSFLVAPLLITDAELQECRAGVGLLRRVAQPGTRNRCPARPSAGDRISRHRPDRGTRCSRRAFMRSAERSKWRSPGCRRTV